MFGIIIGGLAIFAFNEIFLFDLFLIFLGGVAFWSKCFQKNYSIFVFFISAWLSMLLAFLLFTNEPDILWKLLLFRVINTAIGSIIAFMCAVFILPKNHDDVIYLRLVEIIEHISELNESYLKCNAIEEKLITNKIKLIINNELPGFYYDFIFRKKLYNHVSNFLYDANRICNIFTTSGNIGCNTFNQDFNYYVTQNIEITKRISSAAKDFNVYDVKQFLGDLSIINKKMFESATVQNDKRNAINIALTINSVENALVKLLNDDDSIHALI